MIEELNYSGDEFEDILARDHRYNPRAYTLLLDVIHALSGPEHDKHMDAYAIMDEFKETALDQFGPMTYRVLTEWGLSCCEDLGEMMFNLADSGRVQRDPDDEKSSFIGGYDFEETFLNPYAT